MTEEEKRAAIAAYREQKIESGIYALSCLPSSQRWVGSALNLATIRNRLWFTLRLGNDRHPGLQDAWNTHGEDAFGFEILERLKADDLGAGRDRRLKERLLQWAEELQATRI
ncbi:GIY-YIG nuclease family protein [Sphingomonas sp. S-NIH.Pt3_0716]|jgi:hypothetical protein|nr:GIY-YIG nuclease family protein [Sphingomonas sp. S-NIH.Pt3_0716]